MDNKLAFISSPYTAIFNSVKSYNKALDLALEIARFGVKAALDGGYIPFSPVLSFNGVYSEEQRDTIMEKCYEAIKQSSVFYSIQVGNFYEKSQGMQEETRIAMTFGIEIKELCFKSVEEMNEYCFKNFTKKQDYSENLEQEVEKIAKRNKL